MSKSRQRRGKIGASIEGAPAHEEDTPPNPSTPDDDQESTDSQPTSTADHKPKKPWSKFIPGASDQDIAKRLAEEVRAIMSDTPKEVVDSCLVTLFDAESDIGPFDLDNIFRTLTNNNMEKAKDVTLLLLSNGGSIEPAYQISKVCKAYAAKSFRVLVPRFAKSAATLVALGADEIHMGPLSQLGPIDPQIGGLPALGVSRALSTIAELAEQHPGSAEMFAKYLNLALTVEQIGFCERISESAQQYAERLLQTKPGLVKKAGKIARELVHEYKHHGFVIDLEEARHHLGSDWIHSDTEWSEFAERVYRLFEMVNLLVGINLKKRVLVIGDFESGTLLFDRN